MNREAAERMEELFTARDHRRLTPVEETELMSLVKQWENAIYRAAAHQAAESSPEAAEQRAVEGLNR